LTRREVLGVGVAAAGSFAALSADAVWAPAKTEHASVPARRLEVSFDEGWLFHRADASGAQASRFDDGSWRRLDVPHDWQVDDLPYAPSDADAGATTDPSAFAFQSNSGNAPPVIGPFDMRVGVRTQGFTVPGVGWYRKHFSVPKLIRDAREARPGGYEQRVELRFDGVYMGADFWLNDMHLGSHPYGFVPTIFDVTDHLKADGENVVAVRVDTTKAPQHFYMGSGIYWHTWLTITGPLRIPTFGVFVTTPVVGKRSRVVVAVEVANEGAAPAVVQVRATIKDPQHRVVARTTSTRHAVRPRAQTTVTVDRWVGGAQLWSPEAPNLYTVESEVLVGGKAVDSVTTTFGIRSLVFNSQVGFLLNGNPVKVLGGCIHHDHGALGAAAIDRAEERTIETLKVGSTQSAHHTTQGPLIN